MFAEVTSARTAPQSATAPAAIMIFFIFVSFFFTQKPPGFGSVLELHACRVSSSPEFQHELYHILSSLSMGVLKIFEFFFTVFLTPIFVEALALRATHTKPSRKSNSVRGPCSRAGNHPVMSAIDKGHRQLAFLRQVTGKEMWECESMEMVEWWNEKMVEWEGRSARCEVRGGNAGTTSRARETASRQGSPSRQAALRDNPRGGLSRGKSTSTADESGEASTRKATKM